MKYMNIGLTQIRKDPRFIANAALKNTILSEVKTACDELLKACQPNEHTTTPKIALKSDLRYFNTNPFICECFCLLCLKGRGKRT